MKQKKRFNIYNWRMLFYIGMLLSAFTWVCIGIFYGLFMIFTTLVLCANMIIDEIQNNKI